jgi:CheY-like chemotaxis protein
MIVDDEATNRRLVARMLQRLQCETVSLEDGDEIEAALLAAGYKYRGVPDYHSTSTSGPHGNNAFSSSGAATGEVDSTTDSSCASTVNQPFDVILLDIMMRRTNGVDVLVDLRKKFEDATGSALPPVVAMTGNTSLNDMVTYKAAGFVHLLGKPFDNDALKAALKLCVKLGADPGVPVG